MPSIFKYLFLGMKIWFRIEDFEEYKKKFIK